MRIAGEKIALEVDGPHHFTVNTLQPLGETQARRKLLLVRGWTVISIPFFNWSNQSEEYRVAYLQQVRGPSLCCHITSTGDNMKSSG